MLMAAIIRQQARPVLIFLPLLQAKIINLQRRLMDTCYSVSWQQFEDPHPPPTTPCELVQSCIVHHPGPCAGAWKAPASMRTEPA
jgi:hypothetical protein